MAARRVWTYFPTVLGLVLTAIGLVILIRSVVTAGGEEVARIDLWLLARVLMSVAAFAVLLNPLGLVAAAVVVVMPPPGPGTSSGSARRWPAPRCWLSAPTCCFVKALGQTMPVWPWFLAG